MRTTLKRLSLLTLLAGFALLVAAGPAAAAKPCWRNLIDDWYDGRIDKVYPADCYREAMKHAGEDVKTYSSLPADLTRALQSAIRTGNGNPVVPAGGKGRHVTRKTQVRTKPKAGKQGPKATKTTRTGRTKRNALPTVLPGRQKPKGFFGRVLDAVGPNNADSIPLPLIFLAGLALVLTAAGAAGMVTRRVQARRAGGEATKPPGGPPAP